MNFPIEIVQKFDCLFHNKHLKSIDLTQVLLFRVAVKRWGWGGC